MTVNSVIEYSIKFLISRVFLCRSGQLKLKAHRWVLHICTMLYVTMDAQNIPGRKADKLEQWLSLRERSRYLGRERERKRERCLFYFIMYSFILCGYGVASGQLAGVGPLSWVLRMALQQSGLRTSILNMLGHLTIPKTSTETKTHLQNRHWTEPWCLWRKTEFLPR